MIWTTRFMDGPLAGLDMGTQVIDYRLVDRSLDPPEVLYLELLEESSFFYRASEQPLPGRRLTYIYRLARVTDYTAFYQFVGATAADTSIA